jgi:hypothetical protein
MQSGWLTAHWSGCWAPSNSRRSRTGADPEAFGDESAYGRHIVPDRDLETTRSIERRRVLLGLEDPPLPNISLAITK